MNGNKIVTINGLGHTSKTLRFLIAFAARFLWVALAQAQQLPRLKGLKATQVTHDGITVQRKPAPAAVAAYQVYLKGRGWSLARRNNTHTFTGLQPETKYNIRVPYIDIGQFGADGAFLRSKNSKINSVTTKTYVPPPPVQRISLKATLIDDDYSPGTAGAVFDAEAVPGAAECRR